MRIHLIRHGRTAANEKKLYCGKTDLPLLLDIKDEKGEGIVPAKYPQDIDLFFTSGMLRANQTLELIYGPVRSEALPELAEYNFGDFEMKSHNELKNDPAYQAWIADDTGKTPCPGGESREQFKRRVLSGFALLIEKNRKVNTTLTVCHGGAIVYIMDSLFPDIRHFYEWQPANGGGYTITITEEKNEKNITCGYRYDFSSLW